MDNENKTKKRSKQSFVKVIVFIVPTCHHERHYSIPLDKKDTIADLIKKIHLISRLDDENFFGLYPRGILDALRENWLRYHDFDGQRILETDDAMPYIHQTLVLLYISK